MNRIVLKRGDTRTAIRATLLEPSGSPVDLTDASVRFVMADLRGATKIARAIDILNASAGQVLVVFEPPEIDQAGTYRAEFGVTFPDGRRETFPNNDYLTVEIMSNLG